MGRGDVHASDFGLSPIPPLTQKMELELKSELRLVLIGAMNPPSSKQGPRVEVRGHLPPLPQRHPRRRILRVLHQLRPFGGQRPRRGCESLAGPVPVRGRPPPTAARGPRPLRLRPAAQLDDGALERGLDPARRVPLRTEVAAGMSQHHYRPTYMGTIYQWWSLKAFTWVFIQS